MHKTFYSRNDIVNRRKPFRDDVCNVYIGFQGVTFHSIQYGDIPVFGPETTSLNDIDYINYIKYMKSLGFTHLEYSVSWQYIESDYQYPVPGTDLTSDEGLVELHRRLSIAIDNGMFCAVFLAGDGLSKPKNPDGSYPYNDPQGHSYGHEWLMDNLPRIVHALADITPWIIFSPGYDGVFYGWGDNQPQLVQDFGRLFRQLLPNGNLAIEHDIGHIPLGEGGDDYSPNGRMQDFDVVMGEFDSFNLHADNVWQILGRMCRPYNRPPDQIGDPNPPMYLESCIRGKRFYIIYELATFPWVRNQISAQQVIENGRYLKSIAPNNSVCTLP